MWFILESLEPMPLEALHEAGAALGDGLRAMMPAAHIEATLISARAG
jgi:DNA/RNA-binding domain of Phe-tRNA-synthetase-like protein